MRIYSRTSWTTCWYVDIIKSFNGSIFDGSFVLITNLFLKNHSGWKSDTWFKDVGLILHGSDLTALNVLHAFRGKEVIAVAGNSDSIEVKQWLRGKEITEVNHFKIGLII